MDILFLILFLYGTTTIFYINMENGASRTLYGYPRFLFDGLFIEEWSFNKPMSWPIWWIPNWFRRSS